MDAAAVAVEKTAYCFDKLYTYRIPDSLKGRVYPGCRVTVPFGRGNSMRLAVVVGVQTGCDEDVRCKALEALLDEAPILTEEMLTLGQWLKERTFCTLYEAFSAMLPAGIRFQITQLYKICGGVTREKIERELDGEMLEAALLLYNEDAPTEKKKLLDRLGMAQSSDVFEKLAKIGFAEKSGGAHRRLGDANMQMVRLTDYALEQGLQDVKLTQKQKAVTELLQEVSCASVKEVCYFCGVTGVVIKTLEKKNIAECYDQEIYRDPYKSVDSAGGAAPIELTAEQDGVYKNLLRQKNEGGGVSLLFGVTGSGKTQVFLKLIDEVLKNGENVIVMVPEISLTAQTLSIFHKRYGKKVAVMHSALSVGERMDEWKRVKNSRAQIVVGTRSAVFAPFENVGLIIMDEEHEEAYKSESAPRYNAADVARFRCARHKALLVLASATPSIETFSAAQSGRYTLNKLTTRYGNAVLPEVLAVDMRQELSSGNTGTISNKLAQELEAALKQKKQAILFMNRRGYNTFVSCRSCGHVLICPHCSISMTYHSANGRLMCHYCGYSQEMQSECPECSSKAVRYSGVGTQRVEEELTRLFPQARILRMDADTTMVKFSHEKKLAQFGAGNYDIMLGTQMVAKGLDFGNVVLVGVISADQSLYNDDYRSMEKTFALLTQVVGRCGRGSFAGKAIIQTNAPEHPIISLAAKQDYEAFYNIEIQTRRMMVYPPYCDIYAVGFVGMKEASVKDASHEFLELVKKSNTDVYRDLKLIALGPMPARVSKVGGKYRYMLLIKCKNTKRLREMLGGVLTEFGKITAFKNVTAYVAVNPGSGSL